ncbi:Bifunctional purine biosynthesis protein PurH [Candidatus Bilamarchaeum dharawalense]|uniref:Bifunctional purine biosynthesis protein PurH n=1 Tax=Candidatus Bilamarchaeum dharawalense TaxID=2885759 RepID=A0A5E4LNZ8_9ARCH|nr:Bifunctional purine biosynthesis protein PurH [Candidatus Bilamarchaeum dharawalense]
MKVKRALISVYKKDGLIEFARALQELGVEIVSSGGTAKALSDAKIKVIDVSTFTGSPEMMDGRVKTLHPKIHGAILADRNNKKHLLEAKKFNIQLIDMVIVNLYPFEDTVQGGKSLRDITENIDIGGPTLLRAAAKNYKHVAVICNPVRYPTIIEEMKKGGGWLSDKTLERLALDTWEHVSHYDVFIEQFFRKTFGFHDEFPEFLNLTFHKKQDLRYGENPHQRATVYRDEQYKNPSVLDAKQIQGKELSYNNVLDCNAAFKLIREFDEPTGVIVKHNNPCGVASDPDILKAFKMAKAVDPEASFGGVVVLNRPVTSQLAKEIISRFVDIVLAPKFEPSALEVLRVKKNMRVMEVPSINTKRVPYRKYRSILGGLLVQDANVKMLEGIKVVSKRKPTEEEMKALFYAWKIAKYVKSNSIVYARAHRAVGIGAGQMKRVDAAKLAAMIAKDYGEDLKGCAMASDAFFPFRDGIDYAAKLGITAIIQPGGSIRDQEVIKAADEHGMAMVFTGIRHFRH